ncbi:MAG TPA: glycosyltransferase family 39 protein [Candidatus Bathyarchaeia archaeon]|nr:glycosyltransferase family 39 protein [Candidatus Bathyarchaeia archaeon]
MRQLVRRHPGFFLVATVAAFALRLMFLWKFRFVAGDSFIYGDIAKNWLQHGIFAMTEEGAPVLTCIRLPGYPAFVASIWKIAGVDHYGTVMLVQMFFDVGTCYLIAALARLVLLERAAMAAFLLYALNPFTANYVATPLTEVLAIFFTALALLFALKGFAAWKLRWWILCGLAIAAGILIRPDGGILLAAIGAYLLVLLFRRSDRPRVTSAGIVLAVVSLAPLIPWTLRNWRAFHIFQPLAPRYANNPWEFVPTGFNRWVKTWMVDYVSVDDIYWPVPGDPLDVTKLPPRAFDSADERATTERLFAAYNATGPFCRMTPEIDAQFARLADKRIHHAPWRYCVRLPLARVADMWLRPRTESLPMDSHWWRFREDPKDSLIAVLLGTLNLAFVLAAICGATRKRVAYAGLFILWIALRCAFLATLENPEPRYTLECFPVICVFAAANIKHKTRLSADC